MSSTGFVVFLPSILVQLNIPVAQDSSNNPCNVNLHNVVYSTCHPHILPAKEFLRGS